MERLWSSDTASQESTESHEGSGSFQIVSMDDSQLGLEANPEIMSLLHIARQGDTWQLLPINKELSFDHGFLVTVKAIQLLRDKKRGVVLVGLGGPSGAGKTSLAEKLTSVLKGTVIHLENYLTGGDADDYDGLDMVTLLDNLRDITSGRDTQLPIYNLEQKARTGFTQFEASESKVVIVEGTYALRAEIRPFLDIRVGMVGGMHFNLLQRIQHDTAQKGQQLSTDEVLDALFPNFKAHIEPDLNQAQIKIKNELEAMATLRKPLYVVKSTTPVSREAVEALLDARRTVHREDKYLDLYLFQPQSGRTPQNQIRVRIVNSARYLINDSASRIVMDDNVILSNRNEFEIDPRTFGRLLSPPLGYEVDVSFRRESQICTDGQLTVSLDKLEMEMDVHSEFVQVKSTDRHVMQAAAARLGLTKDSLTAKSYMEIFAGHKSEAQPRAPSPPVEELLREFAQPPPLHAPQPQRPAPPTQRPPPVDTSRAPQTSEPWTRSPTSASIHASENWLLRAPPGSQVLSPSRAVESERMSQSAAAGPSGRGLPRGGVRSELKPKDEWHAFEQGQFMALKAIEVLKQHNGPPVIIGIGGPSGSGKTSLAHKLADILQCKVVSLERYYAADRVANENFDEFSALDVDMLIHNLQELREGRPTHLPVFDFEKKERKGFEDFSIGHEGVVVFEGMYTLHQRIKACFDVRIAVTGGVKFYLVRKVMRDLEKKGEAPRWAEVMAKVFPMYRKIEADFVHAHLKISNKFDPVHSLLDPLFVLKSSKQVAVSAIQRQLDPASVKVSTQTYEDIFLYMSHSPKGPTEGDWIRVRNCGGRYFILVREPIREGDFILQPRVDFDISTKTMGGLCDIGYAAGFILRVTATTFQDDRLTIEIDTLENISDKYIQIKATDRDLVQRTGSALGLDGSYTTKPFLDIIHDSSPTAFAESIDLSRSSSAVHLQEVVHRNRHNHGTEDAGTVAEQISAMRAEFRDIQRRMARQEWSSWWTVGMTLILAAAVVRLYMYPTRLKSM
ncbi:nucleoside triphosphate hydrolases superfamily protein [Klebsormidium nitens]|uniref:Nucleoside triphosphate hydrolases superfamily protein n=1 Tax=Klebsormidium nitens TaxID=105231 RepID=A0A1Y1HVE5_KLENI|nr:nucleoside triphosphate hydrolases superfamily protein [Klebsormidium nitens]|eukprot:GAQ80951.1 nucleoside triphosphate hydrolases superfamily protein [Klebsormidium nitens]